MDVSIIGASGDCGREIAGQLVAERVLLPTERLQMVGREGGAGARVLHGLASDLTDAWAETAPELDVALRPDDVVGDIIVMAGGRAVPISLSEQMPTRDDLARANAPIFEAYAKAIARNGTGNEVVIIVTNPVELGVEIFSRHLRRQQVIGIGAYSDSLRFRRELAADLGIRRQLVQAFVVGEHGDEMLPLWSSVSIHGMGHDEQAEVLDRLRGGRRISEFHGETLLHKKATIELLKGARVAEAFQYVERLPPDQRLVLKPYVTHLSGAKTAFATANVVVDLVKTLMDGREILVAGQVKLDGEFQGIHGPAGVPIVVNNKGWRQVVPIQLWEDEARLLQRSSSQVRTKVDQWIREAAKGSIA